MQMSAEQLDIVRLNSGWHSCLAPAGSGKTEILSERVYLAIRASVKPASVRMPERIHCLDEFHSAKYAY